MLRIGISLVASFVLLYVQSVIVMKLSHTQTIYFENLTQLGIVCIINFFLAFSILTELKPWFLKVNKLEATEQEGP